MNRRGFASGALAALLGFLGLPRKARAAAGPPPRLRLAPGVVACFPIKGPTPGIFYCRIVSLEHPRYPGNAEVKLLGGDYQDGARSRWTWRGREGARGTHPFPLAKLIPIGSLPAA